jgi:hypothetical protein
MMRDAAGRPVEVPRCDECGMVPALRRVDSVIGLAVWNHLHPTDQRTALWFCSDGCTLLAGQRLGRGVRDEPPDA